MLAILLCLQCYVGKHQIISDYEFTNQEWKLSTITNFINITGKSKLKYNHLLTVYQASRYYKINALVIIVKMQQENSLIKDNDEYFSFEERLTRATGYALHYQNEDGYLYRTYEKQIWNCARRLRELFDETNDGLIIVDGSVMPCENQATWALFRYLPVWGFTANYKGIVIQGNRIFYQIWQEYKKIWQSLK